MFRGDGYCTGSGKCACLNGADIYPSCQLKEPEVNLRFMMMGSNVETSCLTSWFLFMYCWTVLWTELIYETEWYCNIDTTCHNTFSI